MTAARFVPINLGLRWFIAFSCLVLAAHEAHELVHAIVGRILCGEWPVRDFNSWRFAGGCSSWWPTAAGPLFSYTLLLVGSVIARRGAAFSTVGLALIFAANPFARIFTAMMGGGDEMVVAQRLAGAVDRPLSLRLLTLLVVTAICGSALVVVWRSMSRVARRGVWFTAALLWPMVLTGVGLFLIGNGLLREGLLAAPVIIGTPLLVLLVSAAAVILAGMTLRWLWVDDGRSRGRMLSLALAAVPLLAACATTPAAAPVPPRAAPLVDYHQHLVSPAFEPIAKRPQRDGAALLSELDAAGIERAVVLSVGYSFADERKKLTDPDRLTREENDWTSAEVVKNAPRLIGFCGANPLRPVALEELERCLGLPGMTGIKVHFGNAGITLRDPAHLERMQQLFALAQRRRAPVLIHMRARGGTNYGAEDAHLLLDKILPTAPDIEIVVAHLGASGPGYSPQHDEVMAVFAAAAERKDPRMTNLYFDVSSNVTDEITPADAALVAQRIRQLGPTRMLYGSDLTAPGGSIARAWEIFRTKVPLTAEELQQIINNRTRFAR